MQEQLKVILKTTVTLKKWFYWQGGHKLVPYCATYAAQHGRCSTKELSTTPNHHRWLSDINGGVDIMDHIPEGKSGNNDILVAADYFTK